MAVTSFRLCCLFCNSVSGLGVFICLIFLGVYSFCVVLYSITLVACVLGRCFGLV